MTVHTQAELDKMVRRARRNTLGDLLERTKDRYPKYVVCSKRR
ncbi:hypothetical protein NSA56_16265 [Oceanobacillus caeni]|nr:hypothetical protein [Oceanobacillus caeni]MCR1835897.1 hypothetical protein [Oceanobacillus caeni]MED4475686.1 hypothetical protein [Oceanobacillus caeni]